MVIMNESKDSIVEILTLVSNIQNGKINFRKSKNEIQKIEKDYLDPFFPTTFAPKEKPWDKKYLDELANSVMYGKSSKAYLMHIAEVSKSVYKPMRIVKSIVILILIIGSIFGLVCLLKENFIK